MIKSFGNFHRLLNNRIGVGMIVLALTFVIFQIFKLFPSIYEVAYLKSFFQIVRILHDYTLGFVPFPSIYIVVIGFVLFFFYGRLSSISAFLKAVIAFLIWVINFFYILWGFNYAQPSIYATMDIEPVQIDSIYIQNTFHEVYNKLNLLATHDHSQLEQGILENSIRVTQEKLLKEMGIPTGGRVRIRSLFGGSLLHLRTSGIYIPHAIEGHIDRGLYFKQHPFTMAHEMAHGYSYTDESVCNFLGYLTCMRSEEPLIQYSGTLAYWRYLAKYYRYYFPESYATFYKEMNPTIKQDLIEIRNHIESYKDFMPRGRDIIYDSYLKSHGVKAGIRSYDQMIELIAAYEAGLTSS